MNKFQIFIQDIKENYILFCWNAIQVIAVLLSLSTILNSFFVYRDVHKKIDYITQDIEIYMIKDNSTEEQLDEVFNNKKTRKKLCQQYQWFQEQLSQKEIKTFCVDNSQLFYCDPKTQIKLETKTPKIANEESTLNQIEVSTDFFDVFDIEREGNSDYWTEEHEIEGVYVGDSLRDAFSVGDYIYDVDEIPYQVIGYIKPREYFIAPDASREAEYLDDYIVKKNQVDDNNAIEIMMNLDATYFVTEDTRVLNDFISRLHSKKILDFQLTNYAYQSNAISNDMQDNAVVNGSIALLILFFSISSMTGNMITLIMTKKREYSIHQICGASRRQILSRILEQFLAIYGLGLVIAFLFWRQLDKAYICSAGIVGVYVCSIFVIPIVQFRRETISSMLKKDKE